MPQYDTGSSTINTITNTAKSFSISEVWIIISIILAVIGGIFLFTTYLVKEKENSYTGYKKIIYDFFNFKITMIEPIFRVLYLIVAIAITLSSFSYITINFFKFISILVFGNVVARLCFELLLLTLKSFKDISEIKSKLKDKDEKSKNKSKIEKDKDIEKKD